MDRLATTKIFKTKSSPKMATKGRKMRFAGLEKTPPCLSSSFTASLFLDVALDTFLPFTLDVILDFLYAANIVGFCKSVLVGSGAELVTLPVSGTMKASVQWSRATNKIIRDPINFIIVFMLGLLSMIFMVND